MSALIPKTLNVPDWMREMPTKAEAPGIWIEKVIDGIMAKITSRKGVRKIFGSTDKYAGYHAYKRQVRLAAKSRANQFPANVLLEDGRHRYYIKHGVRVDRLDTAQ